MSDAAFEKWISETSGFTNDDVLIAHAGWNAALASRATGEMPERPQRKRCDSSVIPHHYCSHTGTMAYCEAVEAQIAELRAQVEDRSKPGTMSFVSDGYLAELVAKNQQLRAQMEQKDAEIADAKEELQQLRDHLTAIRKADPDWHEMQSTEADAIGEESLMPCVAHHDAQRDLLRLYIKGEAEIVAKGALATAEESGIRKGLEAVTSCKYNYPEYGPCFGDTFEHGRKEAISLIAALLPSSESVSKEPK